jgi:hypothetical protein
MVRFATDFYDRVTKLLTRQFQVHADSSNFADGVGKKEAYEQVIEQATALFDGQRNWVCRSCIIDNRT